MFFNSKKKKNVIAVLDISSASVGGMLFSQNLEGKPQIISSERIPVNFLMDIDFNAFWRCTNDSLRKIIKKMLKDYPNGPDACLCVFSSPWFLSQTKIIDVIREEPFKITKNFLEKILISEEKSFVEKSVPRTKLWESPPELIEHEFMGVELNGYHTDSPIEKITKTARMYIYLSLGVKSVKKEIEKSILENFGDIPLRLKTFPLLSFNVLRNIINTKEGFLLVDISGEITDIFLIKKDILEEAFSFPRGKNLLLKKIAVEFNTFPEEARSLIKTYLSGHADKSEAEKMEAVINSAREEWRKFFYNGLENITDSIFLPQNLFLVGGDVVGEEFIKCAHGDDFAKFTVLSKPFKIEKILPESLAHYFDLSKIKNDLNVSLLLESLYANNFFKN